MPKKVVSSISLDKIYVGVVFIALVLISVNITLFAHNRLATKVLGAQTEVSEVDTLKPLRDEKLFWEEIIEKHPSYRDAYIELADIENKLGNRNRGSELLNLARGIDPNY